MIELIQKFAIENSADEIEKAIDVLTIAASIKRYCDKKNAQPKRGRPRGSKNKEVPHVVPANPPAA